MNDFIIIFNYSKGGYNKMTLKDKLTFLRENGITIKFLARATGLKASILYHFSSGKKLNEVK